MKIKGLKRGNCIELLEETYLADGTQFSVENPNPLPIQSHNGNNYNY